MELASPYATLKASGNYRNEVTDRSSDRITLFAISEIREKDNVNINILTHLEYDRVFDLTEKGKSVKDAKNQAQREILEVFDISGKFGNSEDMSIFGTGEGDAALLAISILLQGDLEGIRDNIFGWRWSSTVPPFEKYIRNFVSLNYGLGPCDASNEGVVKSNNNEASRNKNVVCRDGIWKADKGIVEPSSSSDAGTSSSSSSTINSSSNSSSSINTQSSSSGTGQYGSVTDSRDNQTYKTVEIGNQTWMAENLNYDPGIGNSACYTNKTVFCTTYGRLYDWETALTVCPAGWHLPSRAATFSRLMMVVSTLPATTATGGMLARTGATTPTTAV